MGSGILQTPILWQIERMLKMAVLQMSFYGESINRFTTFHMVLPNDGFPEMIKDNKNYERPMKTLYLLHGYSACSSDWLTGSLIQELALKYNMAVVMPSGDNSFYLNGQGAGAAYETFVGKEIVEYTRKTFGLSEKKEDTYIGGLSMGGFGAIHTGLKFPQTFGKMFGLSSALIINNIKGMKPGTKDGIADYDYYIRTFGNLNELDTSENNPEYLIKKRQSSGEEIQPIFMACGTEDFLIDENHEFRDFLEEHNVNLCYKESSGIHDWKFWNEYIEPAIQWCLKSE